MQDHGYQTIDAAPSSWLDAGTADTSGTLHGGKSTPPPPPPVDESIINGTLNDDVLQGSTGDNKIYGGKGDDTVVYRGTLGDYELIFDPEVWQYRLTDKISGRDGSDLLQGVERLQFDGISVLLRDRGAYLEDGTELLAPYVPPPPPPPPEGWDSYIGIWDPIIIDLPVEDGGNLVIGSEVFAGMLVTAQSVGHSDAAPIELNGIATLAVHLPAGDA